MKKILFLLLLISYQIKSQSELQINKTTKDSLFLFLSERIPEPLLKNVVYPNSDNKIKLIFYINKEKIPFNLRTNSVRNNDLNKILIESFKDFSLANLNLDFKTKNKYEIDVIEWGYGINKIASSFQITEIKAPNCVSCSDLDFYQDIETCIQNKLRYYFYDNIDFSLANQLSEEKISLKLKLEIDTLGTLKLKSIDAPENFKEQITNSVKNFPTPFIPLEINRKPTSYSYNFNLAFNKGDTPKSKELDVTFDSIFKPNTTNKFANYLKKNLTAEDVKNANLNRINDRLTLYFELQKNGDPFEIRTNARSKNLENKLIYLFKNYNIDSLNFVDKNDFNQYFTSLIVFENGENIIKTNSIIGYSRHPIHNFCQNSINSTEAKNCFSRQVQIHFSKNFKHSIIKKLRLDPGNHRVFINFKIDKEGNLKDISCRAPHEKIKDEVIRIMEKLPNVQPAVVGREKATIGYSIPFTIQVE